MNNNIYMLVEITTEDIALLQYAAKHRPEVDWKALKEALHFGVVAVPARLAQSFQAIEEWLLYVADEVEADCHYDKFRMTKDDCDEIERNRHLAARLYNARCAIPPAEKLDRLKGFEQAVWEAREKEWVSRPRTVWEADHEASETTEDSDHYTWEPAPSANASKEPNAAVILDDHLWINDNAQHSSF